MSPVHDRDALRRRLRSLRRRIDGLSELRALVALPQAADILPRQWSVLESRLSAVESRLLVRLKRAAAAHLPHADTPAQARRLNAALGEIELEASAAFVFFDTYVDVLTQRHMPALGPMLAGCDALAWHAMRRPHAALALMEPPLVYCDRGFGAAIIREQIPFPDRTPNPMPLIQIPYARLQEKLLLTSVFHEAGHQSLALLGLVEVLPAALRAALARAGSPATVSDLYARWSSEIGPDFWTFCLAGPAAAAGLRDLLSLPPAQVLRAAWTDPHPPPYLRVLLGFELCRQQWGDGPWERWERQWRTLYPTDGLPPATRGVLETAALHVPTVARALRTTRFRALADRPIVALFDLEVLEPARLRMRARTGRPGVGVPPGAQLATFRAMSDDGVLDDAALERQMTRWLVELGKTRLRSPAAAAPTRPGNRHVQ